MAAGAGAGAEGRGQNSADLVQEAPRGSVGLNHHLISVPAERSL